MGILGDKFEGRIVIGLSSHKSEGTVKQYIWKISTAQKWDACNELANNILPKAPKVQPTATVSAPPDPPQQEEAIVIQLDENAKQQKPPNQDQINYIIEELNAPMDPMLENFLASFDVPVAQEPKLQEKPQEAQDPVVQMPLQEVQNIPQQQQHTLNMNVNNVQNVTAQRMLPTMYFLQSNVTINYNFSK